MISFLITLVVVFFLFGFTIFVHELGHFLVARWCGLTVDAFAIGFGPAIWKRKINGVQYKIGILPFGGYVALPQLDPSGGNPNKPEEGQEQRALPRVSPFKKILVSLAGVTGNMILAFILAWVIYVVGKPSRPLETNSIIGHVERDSAAFAAGLRIGDEILSINGEPVANWSDIVLKLALTDDAKLLVKSADGEKTIDLETAQGDMGVHSVPGISGMDYVSVAGTMPNSSAQKAGLKPGDLLLSINGITLYSIPQLIDLVNDFKDQDVPVLIKRGDAEQTLTVRPAYNEKEKRAMIGIQFNTLYADKRFIVHPEPWDQIKGHASGIFRFLRALVTPSEAGKASQGVGGPLMIIIMFWYAVKSSLMIALWFTVMVNVNLAIINLLPLPVLDGGHIVFSLWEMLTKRPVPAKIVNVVWNTFAVVLISLFLLLTFRDVRRFVIPNFTNNDQEEEPVATDAPTAAPDTQAP